MLRPPVDLGPDADLLQLGPRGVQHVVDERLALAAALVDEVRDLAIEAQVQRLERQVLELPLDPLDAEPVWASGA